MTVVEESDLTAVLRQVVDALSEAKTPHAFIGALPIHAWARPRATSDLDLVVGTTTEGFALFASALAAKGFRAGKTVGPSEPTDPLPDMAFFWSSGTPSIRVDIFIAKLEFEREVLARARTAEVLGNQLRIAAAEACIIYKLLASRPKDLGDVDAVFTAVGKSLDWEFLDRWSREWEITDRLAPYRAKYAVGDGRQT